MARVRAAASCAESGLEASASTCGSLDLARRAGTADAEGDGEGLLLGAADAVATSVGEGDASVSARLTGSITAPWSTSDTAAIVPLGLKSTGPSSCPGASGNL